MCGRHTYDLTWQQVHDLYRLTAPRKPKDPRQDELDLKPRYNVAPAQIVPACRLNADVWLKLPPEPRWFCAWWADRQELSIFF